ncbi:MAG: RNA recognition motif domain-containing protein [Spirochaeta sp.]
MSNKLYVGNMNYRTNEETLRGLFEAHGAVNSVTIIYDRQTGQSKGFGFVEMESPEAAEAAIEALNEYEVEGRRLRVNVAQPREEGARRPPRRY